MVALADHHRETQPLEEALGDDHDLVLVVHALHEDDELVPPEAGDATVGPHGPAETTADLGQDPVADLVAKAVVDDLEPVEVQQHQGGRAVLSTGQGLQPVHQLPAIGQPGQLIQAEAIVARRRRLGAAGGPDGDQHLLDGGGGDQRLDHQRHRHRTTGSGGQGDVEAAHAGLGERLLHGDVQHVEIEDGHDVLETADAAHEGRQLGAHPAHGEVTTDHHDTVGEAGGRCREGPGRGGVIGPVSR